MPNYIYGCGPFQDIRPGILVFWAFGRGYEPLLTATLLKNLYIIKFKNARYLYVIYIHFMSQIAKARYSAECRFNGPVDLWLC
jgi:hypothetical protein